MPSSYLDRIYQLMEEDHDDHEHHDHDDWDEGPTEVMKLSPMEKNHLHCHALKHICHDMCKKSIPCDDGCADDLDRDIDVVVDNYFDRHGDQVLRYFADTRNTVTDIIESIMDEVMEEVKPISPDNDEFIQSVVDRVGESDDVEEVVKTIRSDIKKHASEDVKRIVDDIKDDEADVMESVFHHYLIKSYQESHVPDDMESVLLVPMIETAFHYVRRILFNDGYQRR